MKPQFSELSFAFAYMAELARKLSGTLTVAPSFPSTTVEGKTGYGYDVKLGFKGIPVFLQFKLAHCMENGNSAEFTTGSFVQGKPVDPVYRFYLMALGKSRQTSLMLKLEKRYDFVFYVAPAFHKVSELNAHFLASSVVTNSRSLRPSRIKKMPDKLEHFVSYRLSGPCHRFSSDPEIVESEPEDLAGIIQRTDIPETNSAAVMESLIMILRGQKGDPGNRLGEFLDLPFNPAVSAQYVARTFFGCELAFFHREHT